MPLFALSALAYIATLIFVAANDKSESDGD